MSTVVNHCQPVDLSTCRPLSTTCQPLVNLSTVTLCSVVVDLVDLSTCRPVDRCQPLSTVVNRCQPVLTVLDETFHTPKGYAQPMSTKMGREGVSFVDLSTSCQPLSTVVNRCQPLVDLSTPWLTRLTTTDHRVTVDKLSTIVDLVDLVNLSTCRPVDLSTICQPLSTTVVDLSSRGSDFPA